MVLILVVAMFVLFVAFDYFVEQRLADRVAATPMAPKVLEPAPIAAMNIVGGFQTPANLAYHMGHAWASKESPRRVRVGLDDFAARLVGTFDQIDLPARGRWLRQGERGWTIARGDHRFEMVSPIEGEVIDVNPEILRDPSLAHLDPYGAGWLMTVNAPGVEGNMKNLLHGRLAECWMEESASSLHTRLNPGSEARLQDGGHAVDDILQLVPEPEWEKCVRELLLS